MKITLTELKKLIREKAYKLFELEIVGDTNNTSDDEDDSSDEFSGQHHDIENPEADVDAPPMDKSLGYAHLNKVTSAINNRLSPKLIDRLNLEINNILETGRGSHTHENSLNKLDEIDYITTVLGSLYYSAPNSERKNIRDYMFVAFTPFKLGSNQPTRLLRNVAIRSGIEANLSFSDDPKIEPYISLTSESIYTAIDYVLAHFHAGQNLKFGNKLFVVSVSRTKNALDSKKYRNAFANTSIDAPLDSEDKGGDTMAGNLEEPELGHTKEQRDTIQLLSTAIGDFLKEKLSAPRHANYLEFYELFAEGRTLIEISEITGKEISNLYVIKNRLEDFVNHFVVSGELQNYIKHKAGIAVKFPDNKFSLSVKGDKEEEEPVLIWQQNKNSDEPGEGQWVEIETGRRGEKKPNDREFAKIYTDFVKQYGKELGKEKYKEYLESHGNIAGQSMFIGGGYPGEATHNPDEEEPGIEEPITGPGEEPDDEMFEENITEVKNLIKKIFSDK